MEEEVGFGMRVDLDSAGAAALRCGGSDTEEDVFPSWISISEIR